MKAIKEEAKRLIDTLPDNATWDDIMYEFYVRKKIGTAFKAAQQGRTVPHEEARKRLAGQ